MDKMTWYVLIHAFVIFIGVKNAIDKANGYCFGVTAEERNIQSMLGSAFGATDFEYNKTQVQIKIISISPELHRLFLEMFLS